jgi:hypothetical protein
MSPTGLIDFARLFSQLRAKPPVTDQTVTENFPTKFPARGNWKQVSSSPGTFPVGGAGAFDMPPDQVRQSVKREKWLISRHNFHRCRRTQMRNGSSTKTGKPKA